MLDFTKFGKYMPKGPRTNKKTRRSVFVKGTDQALADLMARKRKTKWLEVRADGSCAVTARVGVVPFCINGPESYQLVCPTVEAAEQYLLALRGAAEAGQLDELMDRAAARKAVSHADAA